MNPILLAPSLVFITTPCFLLPPDSPEIAWGHTVSSAALGCPGGFNVELLSKRHAAQQAPILPSLGTNGNIIAGPQLETWVAVGG